MYSPLAKGNQYVFPLKKGGDRGLSRIDQSHHCDNPRLAAGDKNIFLLEGTGMIGEDVEATVDSRNTTDLGFWRMAKAFRPVLSVLLRP